MAANLLINKVEKYLQLSPIREIINNEKNIPFEEEIKSTLEEIDRDFEVLQSKTEVPLKVVLMGEVKSGKSTILNSLVEKEISPTDALEATAAIIEVYYNSHEKAVIEFKDKEAIEGDLETIQDILKTHHRDLEFFKSCEKITIGLPLNSLRKIHIVDTPGLGTITAQNEKKTYEYIENADVVLWVFNSTHLGQEDVLESLKKVSDMGKIIVGILNKIDCTDTPKEEIIEYAEDEYGIEIDKFFTLSAYESFKAIEEKNMELFKTSGFEDLLDYILNNIDRNSEQVQIESIISEAKVLISKDINLHREYDDLLDKIKESRQKYNNNLIDCKNRLNEKIEHRLISSVNDLLKEEKEEIKKDKSLYDNYLNNGYINKIIVDLVFDNKEYLENEWQNSLNEFSSEIKRDFELLSHNFKYEKITENDQNVDDMELIKEGAIKGFITSGGASGVVAFYSAVLGPAASYVTIGQAVASICPPLLLAGAVAGAIGTYISKQNKKSKFMVLIEDEINNIRNDIRVNLIPRYKDNFHEYNNNMAKYLQEQFEESQCEILSGYKFELFRENIKTHIAKNSIDTFSGKTEIYHLKNEKIRVKFLESFETAKSELNISSPWMNNRVVNDDLILKMEKCLKRGVCIKIIYGIEGHVNFKDDNQKNTRSDEVANKLRNRFERYNEKFKIKKVNSHHKLLICDEEFYLEGSYNFLSFDGEYKDDVRSEGATYNTDLETIKELRVSYFNF